MIIILIHNFMEVITYRKKKTRNIQKISEDILKLLVKQKGVKVEITEDKRIIFISIYQDFTEDFQIIDEFETDKIFFDKLSDDLKMIRLRGGKDKDKQRSDLLNFVC